MLKVERMATILIIEDELVLQRTLRRLLELEGHIVIAADNGIHGVKAAQEHKPDLIFCDIRMPALDGYGTLARLQQSQATASIPFVFMTAKASRTDIEQGLSLGIDNYLTKPFEASELLTIVNDKLYPG
ncbi:MAG TPA: response regulator [Aggregatilinea sp.]|jgi:CheY-like chemotaxis protein|uniref:response regulator n=1 Tax=Aggregatilinea sp. TaxID=2806333 RepID=UPI002C5946A1|nr:response regulator [Aggregatilinea sp.]HML22388.1 response regulator [Aggregatilinea sp.]